MIYKLKLDKGYEKEDGRSAKSAEGHLGYLCNRPYRRG
jgi:hypothetical protein